MDQAVSMVSAAANCGNETPGEPVVAPGSVVEELQSTTSDRGIEQFARDPKDSAHEQIGEGCLAGTSNHTQLDESVLLSPGFRSAAALAGWDAETLLLAAINQSPVSTGPSEFSTTQDISEVSCAARKRNKGTPLSSAGRSRKVRWENINGSPIGRVPMKPLPLLSDNQQNDIAGKNDESRTNRQPVVPVRVFSGSEEKENVNSEPLTDKEEMNLKGKEKEKEGTPAKSPCLDQLREELSCAVCLDICFEPCTISCGHSFCRTCLQSALAKCGRRCPKCRQSLEGGGPKDCRINTVLWNTIQILFPKESAARIKEQKRRTDEETVAKGALDQKQDHRSRNSLGTRPSSRSQPWSNVALTGNVSRMNSVMANLRTSFQSASELMSSVPRGDDNIFQQRFNREFRVGGEERSRNPSQVVPVGLPRSQHRSRRQNRNSEEQVNAVLVARLHRADLGPRSEPEVLIPEGPKEVTQGQSQTSRTRLGSVTMSAANLRSLASRTVRPHRRARS